MKGRRVFLALAALSLLAPRLARADSVPSYRASVYYSFSFENLKSFPEWVIFYYGFRTGFLQATDRTKRLETDPRGLTPRDQPTLYAVKQPSAGLLARLRSDNPDVVESALREGVVKGPVLTPYNFVPESKDVYGVHDVFRIEKLDETGFVVKPVKVIYPMAGNKVVEWPYTPEGKRPEFDGQIWPDPWDIPANEAKVPWWRRHDPPASRASASATPPAPPSAAPSAAPNASVEPAPPAPASGCGGCAVTGEEGAAGVVFLLGALAAFRGRRRSGRDDSIAP